MKETELAAVVIDYLKDLRWDVHQEVSGIDIVAVQNGLVWGIECKLGMGLEVLEQAERNRPWVHHSSVAVPLRKDYRLACFTERLCRQLGVGMLVVDMEQRYGQSKVEEQVRARCIGNPYRKFILRLRNRLCDDTRNYCKAGSPSPSEWTPFKSTCREVRRYVTSHPGCTTKQLVGEIGHHYGTPASAIGCLLKYARDGIIEGVRVDSQVKPVRWYTEEKAA